MKYFICDDNTAFAQSLAEHIHILEPDSITELFPTITSLLFRLEDDNDVDAVFLDIQNADGNGILAAHKLRKIDPRIKLVYVSGYAQEYSQDIFDCPAGSEPIALLSKPVQERYLKKALEKIQSASDKKQRYLAISSNRNTQYVDTQRIICISSDRRQVVILTDTEEYSCYSRMNDIMQQLPEQFCRCHKSYIVNSDKIIGIDNWNTVTLTNSTVLPIGKVYREEFKVVVISRRSAAGYKVI